MPIFSKFANRKAPPRKSRTRSDENIDELFEENRKIAVKLGEHEIVFENGVWSPADDNTKMLHQTTQSLKQQVHILLEENNMLRLKQALLINMLTQTTAKCKSYEKKSDKSQSTKKFKNHI